MTVRNSQDTITANASGRTYIVEALNANDATAEPVSITLSGTFAGATCTLQVSTGATSPLIYAAASGGAFTAAGSHIAYLVPGSSFKFTTTASGSPQSVITVQVRGQIKLLAA
jgi:hypothetical protein